MTVLIVVDAHFKIFVAAKFFVVHNKMHWHPQEWVSKRFRK